MPRPVVAVQGRGQRSRLDARRCRLLTEHEISRAWRSLFRGAGNADEAFAKAEQLLEELRPESPLRHRLGTELDELRERARQEA